MRSNKKRIRIDYAPLNVSVAIECLTPASPAMQVYNALLDEGEQYEPDRELSPSQFLPKVSALASDGSWAAQVVNSSLAQMHWFVNNEEISTLPEWDGLYTIDTSTTDKRGMITISRNVLPSEKAQLHFEAVLADKRLGTNIEIRSDVIILTTEDASEDAYSVSIGDSQVIRYNPFRDNLLMYGYKVAQGIISESESEEAAAKDACAYLQTIPITVYRGKKVITEGFTIKLYRVNSAYSLTELVEGEGEVVTIASDKIVLDLRVVEKSDYLIKVEVGGTKRVNPQISFSVGREYSAFECIPTNGTAINTDDTERKDSAMVSSEGKIVNYPAALIDITWATDSATKEHKVHGYGESTKFKLADTGIGSTYEDDWLDVYTESEARPVYAGATSESGDVFINEKGENLIIN